MKKITFVTFLILLVLSACSNEQTTPVTPVSDVTETNTAVSSITQPERKLDIYGKITSMEGNEITVLEVDTSKDPTFSMTPEEKKKYMNSLDEATRMALKEEINSATLGEVTLTIPVGIPMTKKTAQGADAPSIEASLADLKNGQYISIWLDASITDRKIAEFVKIAFTQ